MGFDLDRIPHIPLEIRETPRWVTWKAEVRDGKATKIPYNSKTGNRGRSNDESTWATFECAIETFKKGGYDGVGFMFSKNDPYCGIDLDKCRDPTSGKVEPWALSVISKMNSYTEVSPSGTGVHIFVKGALPPGQRRKDKIEVYAEGRYFTVTGDYLSLASRNIEERQEEIEWLHAKISESGTVEKTPASRSDEKDLVDEDKELLDRMFAARNGAKSQALYEGRWEGRGYPSQSEADQAFCCELAFWFGKDPIRMDRVFRQSALYRPKWDEQRGQLTYGQRTIEMATKKCDAVYSLQDKSRWKTTNPSNHEKKRTETQSTTNRQCGNGKSHTEGPGRPAEPPLPHKPFPVDVLPRELRRFVTEAANSIPCDPSYVALAALCVCASAIGAAQSIRLKEGWIERSILWGTIIGESGTAKSPVLDRVTRPLHNIQHELFEERGPATGDNVHSKTRRCIVSDVTLEALAPILETNPKGVLLCADELSSWLDFDRYRGGKNSASGGPWLSLWSGTPCYVDRKSGDQKSIYLSRPHVSILGGTQVGTLKRILGEEHVEDGLLARLLLVYPPRMSQRWTEATITRSTESEFEILVGMLWQLAPDEGESARKPRLVGLSPDAKGLFVQFVNEHAERQDEVEGGLSAAYSKLKGYCARFALLFETVQEVCGRKAGFITGESMKSAVDLTKWFSHEIKRVYAMFEETVEQREQRQLVEWMQVRGGETTARQLQRGPRRFRESITLAEKALTDLVQAGVARQRFDAPIAGGPGTTVFYLVDGGNGDTPPENTEVFDSCVAVATAEECSDNDVTEAEPVVETDRFALALGFDRQINDVDFKEV